MEKESDCKIMIRGKGSFRDQDKEHTMKNTPGWEHLNEPLHVLIEADKPDEGAAHAALEKARSLVERMLIPLVCVKLQYQN